MSANTPIKVAILWHMHQPDYQEPGRPHMILPWVRLHATKDYLDMPLMAAEHESIRTTFNLVPSLLDQLLLYIDGGSDPHLNLTKTRAEELSPDQRQEILNSFFIANPAHMIDPFPHYHHLFRKAIQNGSGRPMPALFTTSEMRDIQVWSNLVWVDPIFRKEEPIRSLFAKEKNYTEEDKESLIKWQCQLMKRVISTYRDLFLSDKIDISFTPYYHPILPLLCDSNVAAEAIPQITLPKQRFQHPEDAEQQIAMSQEKFESLFGRKMVGMWPSEGSISEEVARLCLKRGLEWIATDEDILYRSLAKSGLNRTEHSLHAVYEYGPGLKIMFRDRALSDRIGFVYSGWDADKAVTDLIGNIHRLGKLLESQRQAPVIPIILDGENAWEYFANDGSEFLQLLYKSLAEDKQIETVTMTDAARSLESTELSSLFAGSWINHNFRIWIGHPEDNTAWDMLSDTRKTLVDFEAAHPDYDKTKLERAWQQIYKAEGSDWCWWYGDEHRGPDNEYFDRIFRHHLIAVYELLSLSTPVELLNPIYQSQSTIKPQLPDSLLTPIIDGRLTHFYEWAGAGSYDCESSGGAMHQVDRLLRKIHFGYDHQNLYIRLDFIKKDSIESYKNAKIRLLLATPQTQTIELVLNRRSTPEGVAAWAVDSLVEVAIRRDYLWSDSAGKIELTIAIYDGDKLIESRPEGDPITFEVAAPDSEMFWPS